LYNKILKVEDLFKIMEYLMLFIGIVILVIAFSIFFNLRKYFGVDDSNSSLRTQKDENGNIDFVRCPVCNTPLAKKENLHSRIFRPMNTPDQRMMVQGCPHCFPSIKTGVVRSCPVCKKTLSINDELVARLFNRTENKKHVMIMGCTLCMGMSKNNF